MPVQRQPPGCQSRAMQIGRINSPLSLVDRDASVMASLLIHTDLKSIRTLLKTK
jgi:hypothetical protein